MEGVIGGLRPLQKIEKNYLFSHSSHKTERRQKEN
jgi:hypothetical protein